MPKEKRLVKKKRFIISPAIINSMVKSMIKLFRPFIILGSRSLWYITRPITAGAKVIVIYNNQILLIKNTYGYAYSLPGGGIKKNESPEKAAIREVFEEVGIPLDKVIALPSFITYEEYKEDTVHTFYAHVNSKEYTLDKVEIDIAEWHPLHNLPKLGTVTAKSIELYEKSLEM